MDEIKNFYDANRRLFHSNNRATNAEADTVFRLANLADPRGGHKKSGCGRCYRSALRAIVEYCRKLDK